MQYFLFSFFVFGLFDRIAQSWQEAGRGGGDTRSKVAQFGLTLPTCITLNGENNLQCRHAACQPSAVNVRHGPKYKTDFQKQVTELHSSFPLFNVFESNEIEKEQS